MKASELKAGRQMDMLVALAQDMDIIIIENKPYTEVKIPWKRGDYRGNWPYEPSLGNHQTYGLIERFTRVDYHQGSTTKECSVYVLFNIDIWTIVNIMVQLSQKHFVNVL
jgi:hypothetical protein